MFFWSGFYLGQIASSRVKTMTGSERRLALKISKRFGGGILRREAGSIEPNHDIDVDGFGIAVFVGWEMFVQ